MSIESIPRPKMRIAHKCADAPYMMYKACSYTPSVTVDEWSSASCSPESIIQVSSPHCQAKGCPPSAATEFDIAPAWFRFAHWSTPLGVPRPGTSPPLLLSCRSFSSPSRLTTCLASRRRAALTWCWEKMSRYDVAGLSLASVEVFDSSV